MTKMLMPIAAHVRYIDLSNNSGTAANAHTNPIDIKTTNNIPQNKSIMI